MGGLPALAPAPPALVMNPLMANVLGGLSADDVPFQEGWLKLRGIPSRLPSPTSSSSLRRGPAALPHKSRRAAAPTRSAGT